MHLDVLPAGPGHEMIEQQFETTLVFGSFNAYNGFLRNNLRFQLNRYKRIELIINNKINVILNQIVINFYNKKKNKQNWKCKLSQIFTSWVTTSTDWRMKTNENYVTLRKPSNRTGSDEGETGSAKVKTPCQSWKDTVRTGERVKWETGSSLKIEARIVGKKCFRR